MSTPNSQPVGLTSEPVEQLVSGASGAWWPPAAVPLTPLSFLERSERLFADRPAVVDGPRRLTYGEFASRCRRQAGLLLDSGVRSGDRVAVLGSNQLTLLESHYGVPLAGAALVAMNTRLAPAELQAILDHSGSRVLLVDRDNAEVGSGLKVERVLIGDEYEAAVDGADPAGALPGDEWQLLSVNYTSGTTGRPKGVMYHHRGAYLQALAMVHHARLDLDSVFLWTLPMFHCNGWCFTWAVTAAAAVHVSLPKASPSEAWRLIRSEGVTHLNAAPTVLTMLAADPSADASAVRDRIRVATGGAPPSPSLLRRLADLNFEVTHLYGLTETFGPVAVRDVRPEWEKLDPDEQARLRARQGNANVAGLPLRVLDRAGADVLADGATTGEVAVRGNTVMTGYLYDPDQTAKAIPDGWFRTGDIAVMHPDGAIELRDRSKDLIISGGENIASIEVEQAIDAHPAVLESAVVASPDELWGEVPVAFVTLRDGADLTSEQLAGFLRERIAGFKLPRRVVFGPLPKTSTGKIQKYLLRQWLEAEQ